MADAPIVQRRISGDGEWTYINCPRGYILVMLTPLSCRMGLSPIFFYEPSGTGKMIPDQQ
jgi:hypothetical protein